MPEEPYGSSLFDLTAIMSWIDPSPTARPLVEIGCGHRTFTVPVARAAAGAVHAFDIEAALIDRARMNVDAAGLSNVRFHQRDVLEGGTGLADESARTVLLFNLLHSRENRKFLAEAARIPALGGSVFVLHWRKDVPTPRGRGWRIVPPRHRSCEMPRGLGCGWQEQPARSTPITGDCGC